MLPLALALVLASGQHKAIPEPWPFVGSGIQTLFPGYNPGSNGDVLSLLGTGSVGTASDMCPAVRSIGLTPSACLNGDGTQDSSSGYTLTAVGSPTTQVMPWCTNGVGCSPVARQVVSASNYWQTPSMATPTGDWWACSLNAIDAPLPATGVRFFVQSGAWNLATNSSGQLQSTITGGASLTTSSGIVAGPDQLPCITWHQVASGSNVATLWLDGAQVAQNTSEPDLAAVSANIVIGNIASGAGIRFRGAAFGTGLPTSTQMAQLAASLLPSVSTTRGVPMTFARNSLASCTAPDGSVTWLPPGRPCISQGYRARPSVTNLLTYSEQFDNAAWLKSAGVTAVADAVTAPDGSRTADSVTNTSSGSAIYQGFTASAAPVTCSVWAQATVASQQLGILIFDATSATTLATGNQAMSGVGAWQRFSLSTASAATAGHTVRCQFYPAGNSIAAGTAYLWAAQAETGSIASDYCRSESTSATCAAETATVPTPAGLSTTEGCARYCIRSSFSGAASSQFRFLYMAGGGRLADTSTGYYGPAITDGSGHAASVAFAPSAPWVSGSQACFRATWSASAGVLTIKNLTTGASATSGAGFASFPAFGASVYLGAASDGSGQPLGAAISDVVLGTSAGGCQ